MKRTIALTIACLMMGCKTISHRSPGESYSQLYEAQKLLEAGEVYQAKKMTNNILKEYPHHSDAEHLMAKILDEEISQHKETFENQLPEELDKDQKTEEVKTWLERARSLFEIGAYDEAALAAESVFQYDSNNREASLLLDQIRNQALSDGKNDISRHANMVNEEVQDRVGNYKQEARTWIQQGKLGAARLAVEKVLLLRPEDKEALKLLEDIKTQRRQAKPEEPDEKGKAL